MDKAQVVKKVLVNIALTGIGVFMLLPLLWTLSTSLTDDSIIASSVLIPKNLTLDNYIKAWNFPRIFNKSVTMGTFFKNSLVTTVIITISGLLFDSMAGYVIGRKEFPGRKLFFYLALSTLMIPIYVTVVPMFIIVRSLCWTNTYAGLTVPFLSSGLGIYMFKQYFETLPIELEEVAKIDGASNFRIYFTIMLPLSKPALATMAILKSMWAWNQFFWPLIIISELKMKTLQLALTMFRGLNVTQWGLLSAGMTIAILPPIIIFIALQKYYLTGLTVGAVKG